jgi:hypothetical protein
VCSNGTAKKNVSFLVQDPLFRSTGGTRPSDIVIYNLDDNANKPLEHKLGFAQEPAP